MPRFVQMAASVAFVALAAASLIGLATATPAEATQHVKAESCERAICFVSLF